MARPHGRYTVNSKGEVVPMPELTPPAELYSPVLVAEPSVAMGPTRCGEWLMIDIRLAKQVPTTSRVYEICQELSSRSEPACGVIESTLIVDLLEMTSEDRAVLLNPNSWPRP